MTPNPSIERTLGTGTAPSFALFASHVYGATNATVELSLLHDRLRAGPGLLRQVRPRNSRARCTSWGKWDAGSCRVHARENHALQIRRAGGALLRVGQ